MSIALCVLVHGMYINIKVIDHTLRRSQRHICLGMFYVFRWSNTDLLNQCMTWTYPFSETCAHLALDECLAVSSSKWDVTGVMIIHYLGMLMYKHTTLPSMQTFRNLTFASIVIVLRMKVINPNIRLVTKGSSIWM